jgi:hypothetical protein
MLSSLRFTTTHSTLAASLETTFKRSCPSLFRNQLKGIEACFRTTLKRIANDSLRLL